MFQFINENLRYPEEAIADGIEGTVEVSFVIDGLGKIIEAKVVKGIGYGCDEEAIRLVKMLVFEKVYNRGLNTRTKRSVKIHFKPPQKRRVQINYQVVKKETDPAKEKRKSKTYTITVGIPGKKNFP